MQDYNSISKGILKAVGVMAAITIGGYLLYEVRLLIIYLLVSLVVSMIALPIVDFLKTRLKFPNILAVLSTLLLFVLLFAGFITLFVPLIITQGQNLLGEYYATESKKRVFCRRCASPLYSARSDLPDVIRLRVGIINEVLNIEITSHAFTSEKADWFEILDDHPQFTQHVQPSQ